MLLFSIYIPTVVPSGRGAEEWWCWWPCGDHAAAGLTRCQAVGPALVCRTQNYCCSVSTEAQNSVNLWKKYYIVIVGYFVLDEL